MSDESPDKKNSPLKDSKAQIQRFGRLAADSRQHTKSTSGKYTNRTYRDHKGNPCSKVRWIIEQIMSGFALLAILYGIYLALAWMFSDSPPEPKSVQTVQKLVNDYWKFSEDVSPMDGSKTVTLYAQSLNMVEGWLKTERPTLLLRCKENKTEIFLNIGMSASVENSRNRHTVEIRIDDDKAFKQRWGQSTNGEALTAPKAIPLAKQLGRGSLVKFRFTPFNANPQIAEFMLVGLEKQLPKLADACNWHYEYKPK